MDGLMLYRQYLENIRYSVHNYELSELKSKSFLSILGRVKEIEDLAYIDIILRNAGLSLNFIKDTSFLNKPVKVMSKLVKLIEEDIADDMKDALSDYLAKFTSKEDLILSQLDSLYAEVGSSNLTIDILPESEVKIFSTSELLDKHKETLTNLFGAMSSLNTNETDADLNSSTITSGPLSSPLNSLASKSHTSLEEPTYTDLGSLSDVDLNIEYELEDDLVSQPILNTLPSDSLLNDCNTMSLNRSSEFLGLIESGGSDSCLVIEPTLVLEDTAVLDELDTGFLDDDISENDMSFKPFSDLDNSSYNEEDDFDSSDDLEMGSKNLSNFLECDIDDLSSDSVKDNFSCVSTSSHTEDTVLNSTYIDDDDTDFYSETDPIDENLFEGATNYFLYNNRKKPTNESLKDLYKRKEKIIDLSEVSSVDDSLAKLLLALGDGVLSLPNLTSTLFNGLRSQSKKIKDNMIVGETDDGESDK